MTNEINVNTIIENLTELLQNTVNMTSVFYDIFLNPTPMDVELTQYDADGNVVTIMIPNRAKDMQRALVGTGSPEGMVSASQGTLYVDNSTQTVFVKTAGDETIGWKIVLTEEGVYTYVRNYLENSGFVDEEKLAEYLTDNEYTTEEKVGEIISRYTPVTWVYELPSSGSILLEDNTSYRAILTDDTTFVLPTITDLTKLHRIFVQIRNSYSTSNITLGTSYFFNNTDSISDVGEYDLTYEYDNIREEWVCKIEAKVVTPLTFVNTISASSTDTEYPSAKAVWEAIQSAVNNT